MNTAVLGLWHLGTVTAACLASMGHSVIGFDEAPVVEALRSGRVPVFEPGLEDLVREQASAGRLKFSCKPEDVAEATLVWVAYDTPVDDEDRALVKQVLDRVQEVAGHFRDGALVLVSSQLPAGSTRTLEERIGKLWPHLRLGFACSPENLRLGHAIDAFLRPDRIVVGTRRPEDRPRLVELFGPLATKIEWMGVESAEMVKHALNAFLATSVAFINEIAGLCEASGASAADVERGLKTDARIGKRAYLRPGAAFAGGTLARDVLFLRQLGEAAGLPTELAAGVWRSNEEHRKWPQRRLRELLGEMKGRTLAVLGLTYKPGTNTLRRSAAVELCRWAADQGARVNAFDPAVRTLPPDLPGSIRLCSGVEEALRDSDAALVATEWPEFKGLVPEDLLRTMVQPLLLDPGQFLRATLGGDPRIRYVTIGGAA